MGLAVIIPYCKKLKIADKIIRVNDLLYKNREVIVIDAFPVIGRQGI